MTADGLFSSSSTAQSRRRWETDNRQVEMMPQVGTPYVQPDTPAVTHPTEQVALQSALQSAHSAGLLDLCSMQTCVAR